MTTKTQQRLEKLIANLSEDFSLETLSKSPSRFNKQKLDWFNKEYLKMMTLEEFALNASLNKAIVSPGLEFKQKQLHYRVGDYAFLVDISKQKVMCFEDLPKIRGFAGKYYLIGGGREAGESPVENLKREVKEESLGKIDIDEIKVKQILSFKIDYPFEYPNEGRYNGKEFNIYFYPYKMEDLPEYELKENGTWQSKWVDINEFLADNDYFNYPIWREFCLQNNLKLVEPSQTIRMHYLAWLLDKNRITVLSQMGTDSDTILKWKKSDDEILKWKKITIQETKQNLQEIAEFIFQKMKDPFILDLQQELYNSIFSRDIQEIFEKLTNRWEKTLKDWLTEGNKGVGDYLWPLRVCLSGKKQSPSPFELLSVLTYQEVIKRLSLN